MNLPIYDYIDLGRSFAEVSEESSPTEEYDYSQFLSSDDDLGWEAVLEMPRVVILSEAGSGKTEELRQTATRLNQEGLYSFFIRLEHLTTEFESSFDVGDPESFQRWLSSDDTAWFFLDSVDEARLKHHGDFHKAVRLLGARLRGVKHRARIYISSRASAWTPDTDLRLCTEQLVELIPKNIQINSPDSQTSTSEPASESDEFKILTLQDLNRSQIKLFAVARGITDVERLVHAIDREDAWSFTSRPQDLDELLDFWRDNGCLSNRLEMLRYSIKQRLTETDPSRDEASGLSAEDIRNGACTLAAAATLTHTADLLVPDGANRRDGLRVSDVLPDFKPQQLTHLLSRPIFDEELYGRVRFHHRLTKEYLTAEWFDKLLGRPTSLPSIEALFFRRQYGLEVIAPTLRSVLPWLVLMDERICRRVIKNHPSLLLEGGDPSQLPLDVRQTILEGVCTSIARGELGPGDNDYIAVQRLTSSEMAGKIRQLLQQYAQEPQVRLFLIRAIYLGELDELAPELLCLAQSIDEPVYMRSYAFSALQTAGTPSTLEALKQSFLAEQHPLDRKLAAELVEALPATVENVDWLGSCLRVVANPNPHGYDSLAREIERFCARSDLSIVPDLLQLFSNLLSHPPFVEDRFCELSAQFAWLTGAAGNTLQQLANARHPAALEQHSLRLLHQLGNSQNYMESAHVGNPERLAEVVQGWPELNRALFWEELAVTHESTGEELTDYLRVGCFGHYWAFKAEDFSYALQQVSERESCAERRVALSIAMDLYHEAERPETWLTGLHSAASGDSSLALQLDRFLNPPPPSAAQLERERQQLEWRQRHAAAVEQEDEDFEALKTRLHEHLSEAREASEAAPDEMSDYICHLVNYLHHKGRESNFWAEYDWQALIPDFGESVAAFYRDASIRHWRCFRPQLISEGSGGNTVTLETLYGLSGLFNEAQVVPGWAGELTADEVETACRYAVRELNGFPDWFPTLFTEQTNVVLQFLIGEVQFELNRLGEQAESNYMIDRLVWHGEFTWSALGPSILDLLQENWHHRHTEKLLKILSGSLVDSELIAELAAMKCGSLNNIDHLALWFAAWIGTAPEAAIADLSRYLGQMTQSELQTELAMKVLINLLGELGEKSPTRDGFGEPRHLKALYLLMDRYIRRSEDINRAGTGVFSPGLRDNAQDARDRILRMLEEIPGKSAFMALKETAEEQSNQNVRTWLLKAAKKRATDDADISPWETVDVQKFQQALTCPPRSHHELWRQVVTDLEYLKADLEDGDASVAPLLVKADGETVVRNWLGRELRICGKDRYSVVQEEELADAKRPDLRLERTGLDAPVPIELKLTDKGWSAGNLFERLKNQLCGDYLRDERSRKGIFVVVHRPGRSHWNHPRTKKRLNFVDLILALKEHWKDISISFPEVDDVEVIGIDLTKRTISSRESRGQ